MLGVHAEVLCEMVSRSHGERIRETWTITYYIHVPLSHVSCLGYLLFNVKFTIYLYSHLSLGYSTVEIVQLLALHLGHRPSIVPGPTRRYWSSKFNSLSAQSLRLHRSNICHQQFRNCVCGLLASLAPLWVEFGSPWLLVSQCKAAVELDWGI